jgi:myo-inositol-1(or 4)-monophosphatase
MRRWQSFSVREKSPKDLVTDADLASQQVIIETIRGAFPDHLFVGEEESPGLVSLDYALKQHHQPCWIIDPLDGTLNYVHRLQTFCVSIGMVQYGEVQLGVIFDPVAGEMFVAQRGDGAERICQRTGSCEQLQASNCKHLRDALLACSFPPNVKRDARELKQFAAVLEASQSLRRLGSCALNLCYAAAGRLDGYWTCSVHAWDMVAGLLIATEAGATVTALDGGPIDLRNPHFCLAATPSLHAELLTCIQTA